MTEKFMEEWLLYCVCTCWNTFLFRGSQAFSIIYIHTQNIAAFYIDKLNSNLDKNNHCEACSTLALRAILPTTTTLKHTQHKEHRPLASSAAAPVLSRSEFYLAMPQHSSSFPHPLSPPMLPPAAVQPPLFQTPR
jgi:hypothetical protein